jgi:signal transduction histidine kinase
MGHIGPALVFPLGGPGNVRGVFTIGRRHGAAPFSPAAVEVAASFAAQAGIALELADRRRDAEQLRVFEDRDRIARDLHDQVIQRLYAAGMSLQGTAPMAADPAVRKRVETVVDEMDQAIADIRAAVFSLHSRSQQAGPGLSERIVAIAQETAPTLGFAPTVRLGGGLDSDVTSAPAQELLTVLREALSNSAQHAHASQVDVSVEVNGDLVLRVTDNGTGIQPNTRRSGLANMSERARLLGGTLNLRPAEETTGTGTILEWTVPRQ